MKEPKSKVNNSKGITLVALVISIIVLLILATVSINLVINNGILDKAKSAVDKYSEGEIEEQIKLAYQEYQMSRFTNSNKTAAEYITEMLEKNYGSENIKYIKERIGFITVKISNNGEIFRYRYNANTGTVNNIEIKPNAINYGNKTVETIEPGDDISIGTEIFRVFYNENGIIKAMPFYNITLTNFPVQNSVTEKTTFSNSLYWEANSIIDMNNVSNNIQKYIDAYQGTLEDFGTENVTVRIGVSAELSDNITNEMRNPGGGGVYWLGNSVNNSRIRYVGGSGIISSGDYDSERGVRPIIEINY